MKTLDFSRFAVFHFAGVMLRDGAIQQDFVLPLSQHDKTAGKAVCERTVFHFTGVLLIGKGSLYGTGSFMLTD